MSCVIVAERGSWPVFLLRRFETSYEYPEREYVTPLFIVVVSIGGTASQVRFTPKNVLNATDLCVHQRVIRP